MDGQIISGIYKFENTINNKIYIGSSKHIGSRYKKHIAELKGNRHKNKHFQNAFNKYGIESFKFSVIEQCLPEQVIEIEQKHLDNLDWSMSYNKSRIAGSGGGDTTGKPLWLLDLSGNIVEKFTCGLHLAKFVNRKTVPYHFTNTTSIYCRKYRIITPEFYESDLKIILSWPNYTSQGKENAKIKRRIQIEKQLNIRKLKKEKLQNKIKLKILKENQKQELKLAKIKIKQEKTSDLKYSHKLKELNKLDEREIKYQARKKEREIRLLKYYKENKDK